MQKPLRCRLHCTHEVREDPETKERYEVCVRCDATATGAEPPRSRRAGIAGAGFN